MTAGVLGVGIDEVKETQDFITDLGADSLDMVEIAMKCEEEFGVEINDDEFASAGTVGGVVKLIDRLKAR